ncbi:MAG: hypothetical protein K0S46_145 [Moraxellaceae bacterium]|jgi:hypothetical protein|nr:hypothetical protein [Moraxellaceae bacterium]
MEDFRREAEKLRLAHLLACPDAMLSFLDKLSAAELRALRLACQHSLLQDHQPVLQRSIQASKLLPTALIASIGEHTLGPLLCARACDQMSVPRIASICRHLSPAFMAAVSVHMDVDKLAEMAGTMPLGTVHTITRELIDRKEFITLGEVVVRLPEEVIRPLLAELHDGEAVLRTCFFIESPARLHAILEMMPEQSLLEMIEAAANEEFDLLPHAMALLVKVFPYWQRRLVVQALDCRDETLDGLLRGVHRHVLWRLALPMLEHLAPASHDRLMRLPSWEDPDLLETLMANATGPRLRPLAERLIEAMPEPLRTRSRRRLVEQGMESAVR